MRRCNLCKKAKALTAFRRLNQHNAHSKTCKQCVSKTGGLTRKPPELDKEIWDIYWEIVRGRDFGDGYYVAENNADRVTR